MRKHGAGAMPSNFKKHFRIAEYQTAVSREGLVSRGFIMVMDARPYENQQSREVCGGRQKLGRREVGATASGTNCVTERAVERCNLSTEVPPPFLRCPCRWWAVCKMQGRLR